MKTIHYSNSLTNQGTQHRQVADDVTLGQFLSVEGVNTTQASVRVNRSNQPDGYVLNSGDTIYVSPLQVKGAR